MADWDPLEAESEEKAIGVSAETEGLAIAVGSESIEEWIRYEGEVMDAEP